MSEFTDYLAELFEPFGSVTIRSMFGGYGIYHAGLMFALVHEDTLYLKADASLAAEFTASHLPPFEYRKSGKKITLQYYQAPAEIFEDPELATEWAQKSFRVALAARRNKLPETKPG